MALKSYSSFRKKKKRSKRGYGRSTLAGGISALIGVGLLAETSKLIAKV